MQLFKNPLRCTPMTLKQTQNLCRPPRILCHSLHDSISISKKWKIWFFKIWLHLQSANVQCFLLLHSPIFSGRRHFTVADPSLCSCAPLLLCYFELHKTRNPLTRVTRSSWCNGLGKVNIEKVVFRGNKSATSVKNLQQISSLHGFQSSWFNLSCVQLILLADIPTWWCSAAKHS